MSKDQSSLKESGKKKLSIKEIGLPRLALLCVLGVVLLLLCIPDLFQNKKEENKSKISNHTVAVATNSSDIDDDYVTKMETKLKQILTKVSGIGKVEVMITLKTSKEQIVLKDTPYTKESLNEDDGEGGKREEQNITQEEDTVLVTDNNGDTLPYILQEKEPEVGGILVIAEGGDDIKVIADITEMAEVLFHVPAHKVKVMKMN